MGTDAAETDVPGTDVPGTDVPQTDVPTGVRPRPVHTRTTVLGLLLAVAALVSIFAVEVVRGPGFEAFMMVPVAVVAAIAAGLAWRFGTWSTVLATIVGLLLFLVLAPVFVPMLSTPENVSLFVGGGAYLVGALIAVGGGIAAVVRRHDVRTEATFLERQIRVGALGVVGLLAVFSGISAVTGTSGIDAETRAIATELVVQDYEFGDGRIEVEAGEPVTFIVSNRDWSMHTFTINELGIDVELRPGRHVVIELPALEAGTYRINCRPHSGHHATLVAR